MLSNLFWFPWAQIGAAAPVAPDYFPMGDRTPGLLTDNPARRSRRRKREEIIFDEDEILSVLLDSL